ncbi:MAG TPA: thioesterase family protein [Gemmatimonadota bacterium]|nr:thioesterase family protein [Gemmatimonadota bacterium]
MKFDVRGDEVVTSIEVRYAETDQQGVAYHGNFLVWMEIGRTRYLQALGLPYGGLEARGLVFSVLEARCRYGGAARYEDTVEIATRVRDLRSRTVSFGYELSVAGQRVANGETTLIALDADRRPRRIPPDVAAALAAGPGER